MASKTKERNSRAEPAAWHALDVEAVFESLGADREGLSTAEADARRRKYGENQLPEPHRQEPLVRFLLQFHNVVIYILLLAGIVKAVLQQWVDAGGIFGVVLINALIGFIQEGRVEKALEALRGMMSLRAKVRRDGERREIATERLVPGDVVLLASGDKVPAELRLFSVRELQIDESLLTGESMPVEKGSAAVAERAEVGDRRCLAFSGTFVTSGRGASVVVETGANTELGKISEMVGETSAISTPLIQKVNHFAHRLAIIIAFFSALTFVIGYLVHTGLCLGCAESWFRRASGGCGFVVVSFPLRSSLDPR